MPADSEKVRTLAHAARGRCAAVALLVLLAACGVADPPPADLPAPADADDVVVMVSFDGMRYDFIDRAETPNFRRVAEAGVRASGLIPGYPSKTFPNHYGIATGLYPGHHGLVDNTFYDPELDAVYSIGNRDAVENPAWYGGEPIWVTAETQGVRSASYFWVGTEAPIQGVHPSIFKYYDGSVPYTARVDSVVAWLSLPAAERPRLVMLYFDEPDHIAHERGPDDPAVDSVVKVLDSHLGRLLRGLERTPVADRVTLLLVSDHGMDSVPEDRVVYLDDRVELDGVRDLYNSTQALLYFDGDTARAAAVHDALRDLPHATVYRKGETPDRWHYGENRRIPELIVAAEPGWVVRSRDWRPWSAGGTHGWDPYYRPMQGIFLAMGPGIRAGLDIPAFENVHIYPLVAELLGLEPADGIDGRLEVLEPILLEPAMAP